MYTWCVGYEDCHDSWVNIQYFSETPVNCNVDIRCYDYVLYDYVTFLRMVKCNDFQKLSKIIL